MKRNNIMKYIMCLVCFTCLSQVLWAENILVRVIDNHGIIYNAEIDVVGSGNITSTKNLGPRVFSGLRGGAAYDIHVYHLGKHIKETIMIPIGSNLTVEINVDNYPFTGLLSIPQIIVYSSIQDRYGDMCKILGILPDKQQQIIN